MHLFGEEPRPRSIDELIHDSHNWIDAGLQLYKPRHVFALFSGGHDSLCASHAASLHPRFESCVHINTGTGIPETWRFVCQVCAGYGWHLQAYKPPKPYSEIVLQYGFPGPSQHQRMYIQLKERCLETMTRNWRRWDNDISRSYRIMLLTGARSAESKRRMGHAVRLQKQGARVWCNSIMDWTDAEKHAYMEHFKLPRNPVVDNLCMSGECLCGAFAHPGELSEIRYHYPRAAVAIEALQEQARAVGVHWQWGTAPPQISKVNADQLAMPLCSSCIFRHKGDI